MFDLIPLVVVAIIALGVYLYFHKDTEAKLLAKADALRKDVETYLKAHGAVLASHTVSLNDIEGALSAHGLSLATLEDKAKNVLTDLEASKAVQRIEDAVKKARAELDDVLGTVPIVAAAEAPPVAASPSASVMNVRSVDTPPAAVTALATGTAPATA